MVYMPPDPSLEHELSGELYGDEQLLWAGKPNPARLLTQNWQQVLFGIFWMAIIFFMYTQVFSNFGSSRSFGRSSSFDGFSSIFGLVLGVFALVGVYMISTPIRNYIRGLRTTYAVTDRRAIIIEHLLRRSIKSYSERDISFVERNGDDLIFAREQRQGRRRGSFNTYRSYTYTVNIGFYGIGEMARDVEELLLRLKNDDDVRKGKPKTKRNDDFHRWQDR